MSVCGEEGLSKVGCAVVGVSWGRGCAVAGRLYCFLRDCTEPLRSGHLACSCALHTCRTLLGFTARSRSDNYSSNMFRQQRLVTELYHFYHFTWLPFSPPPPPPPPPPSHSRCSSRPPWRATTGSAIATRRRGSPLSWSCPRQTRGRAPLHSTLSSKSTYMH